MHTHVHSLSTYAYPQDQANPGRRDDGRHASGPVESQGRRILAHIEQRGGDWSIGELAHALHLDKSAVSARVHELLHDTDALIACPRRKDKVSGVLVRPVALAAGAGKGA